MLFLTHFLPIPLFLTSQSRRNPCRRKASVPFCLQGASGLAGYLDMPMKLLALDCPSCGQEIPQQAASGKHYVLSTATLLKEKWNTGAGRENNDCWEKASGLFVSDNISSEHVLWEEHGKNLDVLFLQLLLYQKKSSSWFVATAVRGEISLIQISVGSPRTQMRRDRRDNSGLGQGTQNKLLHRKRRTNNINTQILTPLSCL